jgi:hypothetical protein
VAADTLGGAATGMAGEADIIARISPDTRSAVRMNISFFAGLLGR